MRLAPRRRAAISFTIIALACGQAAQAGDKSPDLSIVDPSTNGGRYLTVHDAENLQQWRYNAGLYLQYQRKALQIQNVLTNQRFDVVGDAIKADLVGAVGFTDWFQAGLAIPVILYEGFYDPVQQTRAPFGTAPKQTRAGLGDLRLETKFRLLDIDRYHVGVAVVPYLIFPTGREGLFLSNETFTGGGKLAVEGNIRNRVWVGGNVGYQYVRRSRQYFGGDPNAIYDDILSVGLGGRVKLTADWSLIGEAIGETNARNAFQQRIQTPIELLGGVQWTPQRWSSWRGMNVTLLAGAGITKGVGSSQPHIVLGINYRKPKIVTLDRVRAKRERRERPAPEAKVEEKIVIAQKIHFAFNRHAIRPISYPILNDVAALLAKYPALRHIRVEGHTDAIGGDAFNQQLSERRAGVVADYLQRKGIASGRLKSVGFGESRPIGDNNTIEGRARNRRTEFTVVE